MSFGGSKLRILTKLNNFWNQLKELEIKTNKIDSFAEKLLSNCINLERLILNKLFLGSAKIDKFIQNVPDSLRKLEIVH